MGTFIKGAIAALTAPYILDYIPVQEPWNYAIAGGIILVVVSFVWQKYVIQKI